MSSNLPPNVPGNASPHKLLSFDEMTILQEHYRLVSKLRTSEEREKALKAWTERERKAVSSLYARLSANGFVIDGQHESGALMFGYRQKSEIQQLMELSDADYRDYRAGRIAFCPDSRRLVRVVNNANQG